MAKEHMYENATISQADGYYDIETYAIKWGNFDNYYLIEPVGQGSYGRVYKGVIRKNCKKCAIKQMLSPMNISHKLEIKILETVLGGDNIIKLIDSVRDCYRVSYIVLEWVNCHSMSYESLYSSFMVNDVKYYSLELLKAIDYCHYKGIIHRDIKPENVLIDHIKKILRLADFGSAVFYVPGNNYSTTRGTASYWAPELFLGYRKYNYAVDLWAFGCIMSEMIFKLYPIFMGENNDVLFVQIVETLGIESLKLYVEKFKIQLKYIIPKKLKSKPWESFANMENTYLVTEEALNVIKQIMVCDHTHRLTALEAMALPYFTKNEDEISSLDLTTQKKKLPKCNVL